MCLKFFINVHLFLIENYKSIANIESNYSTGINLTNFVIQFKANEHSKSRVLR